MSFQGITVDQVERFVLWDNQSTLNVWMGTPGVDCGLHYDYPENFYFHIVGFKKFTLFPPSAIPYSYIYPAWNKSHRQSQV